MKRALINPWTRWLAPLAVLAALGMFFRDELPFLGEGIGRLSDMHLPGVALAVATASASLLAMAEVMRLLIRAGGTSVALTETTAITLASNSWSTTLPGGPAFSAILTYRVQRGWGASAILCGWFFVLSSALSTMWLVLIGASAVFFLGAQVSVSSLLVTLVATVLLSWAVYWATNNPRWIERWARALVPKFNRILRRRREAGLETVIGQIRQLNSVKMSPQRFFASAGWSLANRLLDALTIWASIWAVTGELPWLEASPEHTTIMGVLLVYASAKIAGSAQITPGGLGTVDAAIFTALVASGLTAVNATGVALLYRLISFVLAATVGWVVYFLYYARRGLKARDPLPDEQPVADR
ncbi:lysylphosphatidylglycerol synthase transmembrane domain-containing protein [Corynebacterium alimapuense]|uniref:TIGR00374 family protein n=1 Tax=Corynebacterium alimapuense TaxID=1576874 RepID=A0A3M8KB17_9CORY|nr:YbhN family protein [Corynebacterium alimapuense]RNE49985.1 TIGR00374 family protein [Corynebacterium alimapuense]